MKSLVADRLAGSNFRPQKVETGISVGSGAQTWDGRFILGYYGVFAANWGAQAFRPNNIARNTDGSPNFQVAGSSAYSPRFTVASEGDGSTGFLDNAPPIAVSIIPNASPENPSLINNPEFTYSIDQNPFRSDENGDFQKDGAYETYELYTYAAEITVTETVNTKYLARLELQAVISNPNSATADIQKVDIVKTKELLTDVNGDFIYGIEPSATFDGRLILFHNNNPEEQFVGNGVFQYTYNEDPSSLTGWSVPKHLSDLYHVDRTTVLAGLTMAARYPLAEKPLKDNLGVEYAAGDPFTGAYPWINLDGSEISFMAAAPGGTKSGMSIIGEVTGNQIRHVDGPSNPDRLATDLANKRIFTISPGKVPSFWFPFIGKVNNDGFALPYTTTKPVYPFYVAMGAQKRRYFEIPLEDFLDNRYVSVLRMNEVINRNKTYTTDKTPDTSGNNVHGLLMLGAAFPIEAGIGDVNVDEGLGRSVLFSNGGYISLPNHDAFNRIKKEMSAEVFIQRKESTASQSLIPYVSRDGSFSLSGAGGALDGNMIGQVIVSNGTVSVPVDTDYVPVDLTLNEYVHVAMTAKIDDSNDLTIRIYRNGVPLTEKVQNLGAGNFNIVDSENEVYIGPAGTNIPGNFLIMDEFKLSDIERTERHIKESAYQHGVVDNKIANLDSVEVDLGQRLFFDPKLSGNNTMSCATCHDPSKNFTDGMATPATGGGRNTTTLIGRTHTTRQFVDGRAESLEDQVLFPITNPIEMNNTEENLLVTLNADASYVSDFTDVYGDDPAMPIAITMDHVAKALANFQRSIATPATSYDDFIAGNESALTESEQRGMQLFFGKARCSACHNGDNFSDELFHNTGFTDLYNTVDPDMGYSGGRFKTPTLRGLSLTAPYLHDGRTFSLVEILDLYNNGGDDLGGADEEIKKLELTENEKGDIIEFLNTL